MIEATTIALTLICLALLVDLYRGDRQRKKLERELATVRRELDDWHSSTPSPAALAAAHHYAEAARRPYLNEHGG